MEVRAVGERDDLIVRAVHDLRRRLAGGEAPDVVEVEHVHRVEFRRREEHARSRSEAGDEHHAAHAVATRKVARGARAD